MTPGLWRLGREAFGDCWREWGIKVLRAGARRLPSHRGRDKLAHRVQAEVPDLAGEGSLTALCEREGDPVISGIGRIPVNVDEEVLVTQ